MLVIFDLDGTLFQTDVTLREAVRCAASELQLNIPDHRTVDALIGATMSDFSRQLLPDATDEAVDELSRHIGAWEHRLIPDIGRLFDGAAEMLKELAAMGHTLTVCSNGSDKYVNLVLSSCRIADQFARVRGRNEHRDKARLVGDLLAEFDTRQAILVGDRMLDIEAARANRIPVTGAAYGYAPDEAGTADFIARSPSEITGIVARCDVFCRIESELTKRRNARPLIVGVNGIDTSGKTTFARQLDAFLRSRGQAAQLIHLDDFHNCREIRNTGAGEIEAYINNAFDLDRLQSDLLDPLSRKGSLDTELTLLDLDSDTFANCKRYQITMNTVVILEGVLLYREPLDEWFDYRIFLDISFGELLRRAERRDVPRYGRDFLDRYRRKYIPVQKWYIETCNPREKSDLVVVNNDYQRPFVVQS